MLKLWGEVRGVMGRGGDKCGVAVLGIWGSRKWVTDERGPPSEIRSVQGCAAPDGVRCDPRSPQMLNAICGARGHIAFGVPCAICDVRGSTAPADARRDSRCPWTHGAQSAQRDSRQLKYALWWLLV